MLPFAAAISSGIGTLVGGGSIKDAAISAALGGATGGLSALYWRHSGFCATRRRPKRLLRAVTLVTY